MGITRNEGSSLLLPPRPFLLLLLVVTSNVLEVQSFAKSSGGGGFGAVSKSVELTYTPDMSDATATLVNFLKKFKSTGLNEKGGVEVGTCLTTGRRGVYATRAFKKGDPLCRIPSDCVLALSDPSATSSGGDDLKLSQLGQNFLTMYAQNADEQAKWAAYFNVLPTSDIAQDSNFSPTPDYFTEDEIAHLEHPQAIQAVLQRQEEIRDLAKSAGISVDTLRFATWIVSSRSFSMSISDDGGGIVDEKTGAIGTKTKIRTVRVLVPYLDFINHSSSYQPNTRLHLIDPEKDEAWFSIQATRPIAKGKEITIAYGSTPGTASSVDLFTNYGFVPDVNKLDAYYARKAKKDDDGLANWADWSTTLEEDLAALQNDSLSDNMRNILSLRIRLKRAYDE